MPLVDYRCEGCGRTTDVFAPNPVPEEVTCDACGGAARRQFGLGGLLGVKPAKRAKELLDRERATTPRPAGGRPHHDHHQHHHHHHHHDHDHDHGVRTEEHDS
jgi:putative FmdB family regulatory protein